MLEGMRALLGVETPVVVLLRDPVARYRSGLAMSRCGGDRRRRGRRRDRRALATARRDRAEPRRRQLRPESKYHDRFAANASGASAMEQYLDAYARLRCRGRRG